jgi:hypothetical protein
MYFLGKLIQAKQLLIADLQKGNIQKIHAMIPLNETLHITIYINFNYLSLRVHMEIKERAVLCVILLAANKVLLENVVM